MDEISTTATPDSIGPFSQGIVTDSNVYVSGQGPVDPSSGDIIDGDVRKQTRRTLENIAAVLDAADRSLDDVVKTTVFVTDMADYEAVNEVYAEYMTAPFPARSAVEVASLPVPIDIEIEAIAE